MTRLASPEPRLSLADWRHAERLFHIRRQSLLTVDTPMVLISQIQRSGGTLLNSLLDGHPQLHVHPWEFQIGHPTKVQWPRLEVGAAPDDWLEILREPWVVRTFETGYRKDRPAGSPAEDALPATIVPSFLESLFRVLVATDPPPTGRAVLNRYFTAFFGAWLDCQGLWDRPKVWLAGFCPRLAWGDSRRRWRADYPDGVLITVLRDPRGWYASARSHGPDGRYLDLEAALSEWRQGADQIAEAKRESPDRVFVTTYERLVSEPESVMRAIAGWLRIDWAPSLLRPTLNRRPVPPNSSFDMPAGGIRTESLDRWREALDDRQASRIHERELPSYEAVRELADVA